MIQILCKCSPVQHIFVVVLLEVGTSVSSIKVFTVLLPSYSDNSIKVCFQIVYDQLAPSP